MPAATPRSTARRTALIAQAALVVFVLAGVPLAILSLPKIKDPSVAPPVDFLDTGSSTPTAAARPADLNTIGRVLTVAAAFPPPPPPNPDSGTGTPGGPVSPTGPANGGSGPDVRFLGAIAEPNQFVALLSIDGRQKFLRQGESFSATAGTVTVVSCSASEVEIEVSPKSPSQQNAAASRRTLQMAARSGSAFTVPGAAPAAATGPAATLGASSAPIAPSMPGLPPGFTPPPGMSPEQIEQIRQSYQRAQREAGGDGSQ